MTGNLTQGFAIAFMGLMRLPIMLMIMRILLMPRVGMLQIHNHLILFTIINQHVLIRHSLCKYYILKRKTEYQCSN